MKTSFTVSCDFPLSPPGYFGQYSDELWTGGSGFVFGKDQDIQTSCGAHPGSYPVSTEGSSPGIKWPRCAAVHKLPFRVENKNGGAAPPRPHTFPQQQLGLSPSFSLLSTLLFNDA